MLIMDNIVAFQESRDSRYVPRNLVIHHFDIPYNINSFNQIMKLAHSRNHPPFPLHSIFRYVLLASHPPNPKPTNHPHIYIHQKTGSKLAFPSSSNGRAQLHIMACNRNNQIANYIVQKKTRMQKEVYLFADLTVSCI